MTIACHYAIVRFLPYVETGEFANVGVVLFAPNTLFFGFKLLVNRYARVTGFFPELDAKVFRSAMKTCREEMQRLGVMIKQRGVARRFETLERDDSLDLWHEIIKPRETMLRFSESRLVLADDARAKVKELYARYVERSFVTPERQEAMLERGVKTWLKEAELLERFHPGRVGNDEYHARFPFIEGSDDRPEKIIKPLNLRYDDAARIIDHGGQWLVRVNALRKRQLLPGKVLFTVDGHEDGTPRGMATREVVDELRSSGVKVVPYRDVDAMLDFARQ